MSRTHNLVLDGAALVSIAGVLIACVLLATSRRGRRLPLGVLLILSIAVGAAIEMSLLVSGIGF